MDVAMPDQARAKKDMRTRLLAVRRERSDQDRADAARANAEHLMDFLSGARTVCGYLPLDSEPLRVDLLDALVERGCTVLVPVVSPDAPLDWCRYPSATSAGAFGIAEPDGPRLGPDAVATADTILVPALAVDRSGARLGRGGGHYDRTLALLPITDPDEPGRSRRRSGQRGPELVAVLFDGELLDEVPTDRHDRSVTAVVRPRSGVHRFRS